ncbi:MAG: Mpo1-like protein [Burkholderiales bacterium]
MAALPAHEGRVTARKIDELFDRYGESHRNPANKAIHWICVPLITWSLIALLWSWTPIAAYALIALAVAFYAWLSPAIAVGMLGVSAVLVYPLTLLGAHALVAAAVVFVLAWIGQFIGHMIEGKKPSFFEDVKFLLVGPAWLLGHVYRRVGIPY